MALEIECMDIDGNIDACTQYTYPWSTENLKTIQIFREYINNMSAFIESIEKEGPVGKVIHRKPKAGLNILLGKAPKKQLCGQELHQY